MTIKILHLHNLYINKILLVKIFVISYSVRQNTRSICETELFINDITKLLLNKKLLSH